MTSREVIIRILNATYGVHRGEAWSTTLGTLCNLVGTHDHRLVIDAFDLLTRRGLELQKYVRDSRSGLFRPVRFSRDEHSLAAFLLNGDFVLLPNGETRQYWESLRQQPSEADSMAKANREEYLTRLYSLSDANPDAWQDMSEIGQAMRLSEDEVHRITQFLRAKGLMEYKATGGQIGITHDGINSVEETLKAPDVRRRQEMRVKYLRCLGELAAGNLLFQENLDKIGEAIGLKAEQTEAVVRYLTDAGLVEHRGSGGMIGITVSGIEALEDLSEEERIEMHLAPEAMEEELGWDAFICHASEDKEEVVEPLVHALQEAGIRVWYDRHALKVGDSLRRKIDEGLAHSTFGIVILSPAFFGKRWTQHELDGLVQREVGIGVGKVILPVWHDVDHSDVAGYSVTLAGKLAVSTGDGIPHVCEKLLEVLRPEVSGPSHGSSGGTTSPEFPLFEFGFETIAISPKLHSYSLTVAIQVRDKVHDRLRIVLLWPERISVTQTQGVRQTGTQTLEGFRYAEYWIDVDERLFPGQTVVVVGPDAPHALVYEFDNESYDFFHRHLPRLKFEALLDGLPMVSGEVPFSDLNQF